MRIESATLAVIGGMALATYATRAGGLWLMERIPDSPRLQAWLRHLPGTVLVALIAPATLARGPAETCAAFVTLLVAARAQNLLLAMAAGITTVVVLRNLL